MECPYCKKEMKTGYLHNGRQPLHWVPEDRKPSVLAFSIADGGVSLCHKPSNVFFHGYKAEAYYCADCRVMMAKTEG